MFSIHKQVIDNIQRTNIHTHGNSVSVLDAQRMKTLWEMICEENDSQLHLVDKSSADHWLSMKKGINSDLDQAVSDEDIVAALGIVIRALSAPPEYKSYRGMQGDVYQNVAHIPEEELRNNDSL